MKKLLFALLLAIPFSVMSQAKFQDLSFDKAMELAQKQNKIILVDVMRPGSLVKERESIEKNLFTQKDVADYLNKNVVCIRVDMFGEAGKEFAPRLMMNMYPTYGFYHASGELIKVNSPFVFAKDQSKFMPFVKECVKLAADKKANSRKIEFQNISFEQALEQAKTQKKMIFIDAYTDNCQPCMMMAQNVFTIDKVADLYNNNFINLKLNLGTVEKELAKKYGTTGYPSYLFINEKGELVFMESGYTSADKFMGYANSALKKFEGIVFEKGSWADMLAKSKTTGKPIFVDCYTTWCGPCKMMSNTVFKEAAVADYFNETFINYKVDMEKGEGIDLKKQFAVRAYPTFVFVDAQGNVLNRIVGSMSGSEFVEKAKQGMTEMGLSKMQARYAAGERGEEFLLDYISVLDGAYLQKEVSQVANDLFKTVDISRLKEPTFWKIFYDNIEDPSSPLFNYVVENKSEFEKLFGKDRVDAKLFMVWSIGSRQFLTQNGDEKVLDKKGFNSYVKRMKKANVDNIDEIVFNAKMFNAVETRDWKTFVTLGTKRLNDKNLPVIYDSQLYNWGCYFEPNCADKALRAKVAVWFEDAVKRLEAEKKVKTNDPTVAAKMVPMGGGDFTKLYTELIAKLKK